MGKRSGQVEMCDGIISIGLKASAQPHDRFGLGAELQFGNANIMQPSVNAVVARRKPQCFLNVGLGFLAAADKDLGDANGAMSIGQIPVQRQCPLAF